MAEFHIGFHSRRGAEDVNRPAFGSRFKAGVLQIVATSDFRENGEHEEWNQPEEPCQKAPSRKVKLA